MTTADIEPLLKDERTRDLLALLIEHEREPDPEERANIQRTFLEILRNEPVALPQNESATGGSPRE